jgi:hypothetical protein
LSLIGHADETTAATHVEDLNAGVDFMNQLKIFAVVNIVGKLGVLNKDKIWLVSLSKPNVLYKRGVRSVKLDNDWLHLIKFGIIQPHFSCKVLFELLMLDVEFIVYLLQRFI